MKTFISISFLLAPLTLQGASAVMCVSEWECGDRPSGSGLKTAAVAPVPSQPYTPFAETEDPYEEELFGNVTSSASDEADDGSPRQLCTTAASSDGCSHYGSCIYQESNTQQLFCPGYGSPTTYQKCCCQKLDILNRFKRSVFDLIDNTFGPGWDGNRRHLSSAKDEITPWIAPKAEDAEPLNEEAGIYVIRDFLDDNEADQLLSLVKKYGDDLGRFGRCSGNPHDFLEQKQCMSLKPRGSYEDEKDQQFVTNLMKKIKAAWIDDAQNIELAHDEFIEVHRLAGDSDSDSMKLHTDSMHLNAGGTFRPVTFLLYLTDSEVGTVFPNADVTVVPKKGMAATWVNSDEDGQYSIKTVHASQEMPAGSPDRYVVAYWFLGVQDKNMDISIV